MRRKVRQELGKRKERIEVLTNIFSYRQPSDAIRNTRSPTSPGLLMTSMHSSTVKWEYVKACGNVQATEVISHYTDAGIPCIVQIDHTSMYNF